MLQQAVDYCVLVDNTELGTVWLATELEAVFNSEAGFHYCSPMKNLGIAAAQNFALEHIYQNFSDHDHVIFFDQDSQINTQLPRELAQRFEQLNQREPVAAVGPSFIDEQKGFTYPQLEWSPRGVFQRFIPDAEQDQQKVCALISSGMLSNVQRLKQIGSFDNKLFMDYVDIDWCLRAQHQGFGLYLIPAINMQHSIGSKSVRVLGRELSIHSPLRRYYMLRNSFILQKKHYVSRLLGYSFIYRTLVHHLIIIALIPSRKKQIAALVKGLKHGLKH